MARECQYFLLCATARSSAAAPRTLILDFAGELSGHIGNRFID
jgi:hypothetical protein